MHHLWYKLHLGVMGTISCRMMLRKSAFEMGALSRRHFLTDIFNSRGRSKHIQFLAFRQCCIISKRRLGFWQEAQGPLWPVWAIPLHFLTRSYFSYPSNDWIFRVSVQWPFPQEGSFPDVYPWTCVTASIVFWHFHIFISESQQISPWNHCWTPALLSQNHLMTSGPGHTLWL